MCGSFTDLEARASVKRRFLLFSLASIALFVILSFFKGTRQNEIFVYDEFCDYRMFIHPSMTSQRPYYESSAKLRDACYPPIAYIAVRALSIDKGEKWSLAPGEIRLVLSLLLAQILGAMLLVNRVTRLDVRLGLVAVIMMSPASMCTLLRGNPSGWSFAFVCVFLHWYDANNVAKRMAAAVALGAATSLKLTPCLFGVLYLTDIVSTSKCMQWREILLSALSASILIFLPFLFFGGFDAIPQWISNASANVAFYSVDNPIWGFAALANHIIDSPEMTLPSVGRFALATRIFAAVLLLFVFFTRNHYKKLLYLGVAMAFMTHHDYGGMYLVPAFVAWMCDIRPKQSNISLLLEIVAWFFILTPLQIPNPCYSGTLNPMFQNESLFVLLLTSLPPLPWSFMGRNPPLVSLKSPLSET